jgi:hypothetical protein
MNTQIQVEITINIYMQHKQAIPINIKTCINTQHAMITQLILIFYRRPPFVCRPSTILTSLDHVAHISQKWVTPKLGLNTPWVKRFLARLRQIRQQEGSHSRRHLTLTTTDNNDRQRYGTIIGSIVVSLDIRQAWSSYLRSHVQHY